MENRKMILNIETGADNLILRQKAKEVKEIDSQIKELVLTMIKMVKNDNNAVGLAAPQVGYSLQIIVIKHNLDESHVVLINPKITKTSFRKTVAEEGCLSLPNIFVSIKRPSKITVKTLNKEGAPIEIKAEGVFARIIQHEVDHLNGILIIDHA